MSMPIEPMTELEAVNFMLLSVGESPVNSLSETRSTNVHLARRTLHQVSRQTQSVGLICNSEEYYKFSLEPVGLDVFEIRIPSNILRIDASDNNLKIVRRGNKLYDRENHTYNFEEPMECDVVWFLPFEELPQVVRDYIAIKASRIYQAKVIGSGEQFQFSVMDEQEAYARLVIEEIDNGDYNMFDNAELRYLLRRS